MRLRDRLHELCRECGRTDTIPAYFRVAGCDPVLNARYRAEGIDRLVLWADAIWAGESAVERREQLASAAVVLGVAPHRQDQQRIT